MEALNRKVMFGWFIGLFLFLWMGYLFGYFFATDQTVSGLKQREADWESKSETFQSQNRSLSGKLDRLESAFADKANELKEAQVEIVNLKRGLLQAQTSAQTERQEQMVKITLLEEALNVKADQLRNIQQRLMGTTLLQGELHAMQSPLTLKQIVTAKQAFNDIQHEVAAGNFKGLNLTIGYQKLRIIFDNPDLEHLIGVHDAASGQSE